MFRNSARPQYFLQNCVCSRRSLRSACAPTRSDQGFRCAPEDALDAWLSTECLAKILLGLDGYITKTRLFKYIEHFTTKTGKFSDKKKSDIFHISTQNIHCGYSFLCFSKIRKNNVYPCKPQFYYIKLGFKGGQNYIGVFSR